MKIFKNRAVAWVVLVLAVVGSVCIGLSRKDSFLAKEPVALPEVEYQQWICDEADMLSDDTVAYITERNADWDAKYYAVVAVATADSIQGWTPEEAAKQLGADWKLGKNDMLLLMVRNNDYYVACGDSVLAVLNQYDTMQAKLKQSIEGLYYSGDFDGAAAAFFRQADVFYGQMAQMQPSSGGYSNSYNSGGEWNAPAKTGSGGVSLGSVVLLIAAILAALAALISEPLPRWLHGDEAIRADACAYFLTFALMVPFSQLNSLCASFLQSAGDMVSPSVLNAVMCVLDVFFNALFIPRCGVFGAGLGTASACAVVSLLMAAQCLLRNPHLHLRRKEKDAVHGAILKKAFRIGFPVALQEVFLCAAMVVQTRIIAPLGAVAVAANSFAVTAEGFCYMPGYGLGAAAATLVGRSVGAGETRLARQQGNICTAMGALFMAVTAGIMALICPWVFRLLTPDEGVRALATQVLRIALLAESLYGVSIVAAGALRGTGDTFVPSIMNLCSIWIVRLGLALVLVPRLGLRGMWIAMAIELCVRGLLMLFRQLTTKYYEKYKKEPV